MTAKNGRLMEWCTCAECGIKKTRFVESARVKTSTTATASKPKTTKPKKASKSKKKNIQT